MKTVCERQNMTDGEGWILLALALVVLVSETLRRCSRGRGISHE
jgi:hypothetical protein